LHMRMPGNNSIRRLRFNLNNHRKLMLMPEHLIHTFFLKVVESNSWCRAKIDSRDAAAPSLECIGNKFLTVASLICMEINFSAQNTFFDLFISYTNTFPFYNFELQ